MNTTAPTAVCIAIDNGEHVSAETARVSIRACAMFCEMFLRQGDAETADDYANKALKLAKFA